MKRVNPHWHVLRCSADKSVIKSQVSKVMNFHFTKDPHVFMIRSLLKTFKHQHETTFAMNFTSVMWLCRTEMCVNGCGWVTVSVRINMCLSFHVKMNGYAFVCLCEWWDQMHLFVWWMCVCARTRVHRHVTWLVSYDHCCISSTLARGWSAESVSAADRRKDEKDTRLSPCVRSFLKTRVLSGYIS